MKDMVNEIVPVFGTKKSGVGKARISQCCCVKCLNHGTEGEQ